ncbi:LGFP repeat-containing protein [Streptomyces sp. NPDC096205]|uniref:LGFP repeat-containing protein n=1 Tax=Streptomyces sp. NPDC096205 TaxID=3366081 RepID=UPI003808CF20
MTAIDEKWAQIQWIGPPFDAGAGSGEGPNPDGRGSSRDFANGSIYWSSGTGAHEVHGDIRLKYAQLRGSSGFLGYPATDELGCPDGVGRFNHFEGGSIYWTPQTGSHEVHGAIRDKWASMGWETCYLGYPVSDEMGPSPDQRVSRFQHGDIIWSPQAGAVDRHSQTID